MANLGNKNRQHRFESSTVVLIIFVNLSPELKLFGNCNQLKTINRIFYIMIKADLVMKGAGFPNELARSKAFSTCLIICIAETITIFWLAQSDFLAMTNFLIQTIQWPLLLTLGPLEWIGTNHSIFNIMTILFQLQYGIRQSHLKVVLQISKLYDDEVRKLVNMIPKCFLLIFQNLCNTLKKIKIK